MKNIEKYRDKLLSLVNVCNWYDYFNSDDDCVQDCRSCEERFVKWLFEDCEKKPVLDEKEREYLSHVLNPFKLYIRSVAKYPSKQAGCDREFICVRFIESGWQFPSFKKGTMYKGMKCNREYTLEELGL